MKWPLFAFAVFALMVGFLVYHDSTNRAPAPEIIAPEVSKPKAPVSNNEAATMRVLTPLVAKWEGKRNVAYLDLVGKPTICYGHTRTVTKADVRNKRRMSDAQCTALLQEELVEYRDGLHRYFTSDTKAKRLPPKRDAAFVSLAYNVGIYGAGKSTATRRLNAGDIKGACSAIAWWNRAGQKIIRGLVNRRAEEVALCMEGVS